MNKIISKEEKTNNIECAINFQNIVFSFENSIAKYSGKKKKK